MKGYENTINIFIVDCNESSSRLYAGVCRMLKGADVYSFSNSADAVKFARSSPPGAVIIACYTESLEDSLDFMKSLSCLECQPMIIAVGPADDFELEVKITKAGALNYLSTPINNDKLFYLVKNIADIIKSKNSSKNGDLFPAAKGDIKGSWYFQIISVRGYSDVALTSRNISSMSFIKMNSGNLIYIRFMSFLYDFFVRTFLSDKNFSAGVFADDFSIIIEFFYSEDIEEIIKETIFYFVAEKYYYRDGDFCGFNINFMSDEFYCAEDCRYDVFEGIGKAPSDLKFAEVYKTQQDGTETDFFIRFSKTASHYALYSPLFEYLRRFSAEHAMNFNVEERQEKLDYLFTYLDALIEDFDRRGFDPVSKRSVQDRLIGALMKIMLRLG